MSYRKHGYSVEIAGNSEFKAGTAHNTAKLQLQTLSNTHQSPYPILTPPPTPTNLHHLTISSTCKL